MVLSRFFPLGLPNNPYCAPVSLSFQFSIRPLSCCARVFGVVGVSERFANLFQVREVRVMVSSLFLNGLCIIC